MLGLGAERAAAARQPYFSLCAFSAKSQEDWRLKTASSSHPTKNRKSVEWVRLEEGVCTEYMDSNSSLMRVWGLGLGSGSWVVVAVVAVAGIVSTVSIDGR